MIISVFNSVSMRLTNLVATFSGELMQVIVSLISHALVVHYARSLNFERKSLKISAGKSAYIVHTSYYSNVPVHTGHLQCHFVMTPLS